MGLALVHGLIYVSVIPAWQAPDEPGHFEAAWLTARLLRRPTQADLSPEFEQALLATFVRARFFELINQPVPDPMPARLADLPWQIHAGRSRPVLANRFSLAYAWQAAFLIPFPSQDLLVQLRLARLSSLMLNLGIVWLALKTFAELLPAARRHLAWPMAALVALMPQHTFINSMVGDGPLAELMACVVLYSWARLFRRGATAWAVAGIVLGTAGAIWTKATTAFLLPLDVGLAVAWLLLRPRRSWTWRQATYLGVGVALLGLTTWALTRVASPLTPARMTAALSSLSPDHLLLKDATGLSFGGALLLTHDSFWAIFGWMAVPVSNRWYGALLLLAGAAALGWLVRTRDREDLSRWASGMMFGSLLVALIIYTWTQLLTHPSGYYQCQGRYLFPVIIPFAYLLVGGWARILPPDRRGLLVWFGVLFVGVFDAWSLLMYLIPRYGPHLP